MSYSSGFHNCHVQSLVAEMTYNVSMVMLNLLTHSLTFSLLFHVNPKQWYWLSQAVPDYWP